MGGLFQFVNGATIKNLGISGTIKQSTNSAGFVGVANGTTTIENCYNECDCGEVGKGQAGGLVAIGSDIIITNCYNTGTIMGSVVGGISALPQGANGKIENCYNTGDIIATSGCGGINYARFCRYNKLL